MTREELTKKLGIENTDQAILGYVFVVKPAESLTAMLLIDAWVAACKNIREKAQK